MSDKIGKEIKESQSKTNSSNNFQKFDTKKNNENENTYLGNKRERTKEENYLEISNKKICDYCKNNSHPEIIEIDKSTPTQNIIDFISKKIKEQDLLKNIKDNIDKLFNCNFNKLKPKIIFCLDCFFNNFSKWGIEKFFINEQEINFQNFNNSQEQAINQLTDIYSINLNLAIQSLKNAKDEYSKTIEKTNEVFENAGLRMMLSNNKEAFQDLKKNIDKCKQDLQKIGENFKVLIKDLTSKEENKRLFIEGIYSNNDIIKENLIKHLKKLENKIELSRINISAGGLLNNDNNKNIEEGNTFDLEKEQNDIKNNKQINNDKNNMFNNNINTNQLLNLQNTKKQNMNEQLLLNNFDKTEMLKTNLLLTQNNFGPDSPFISPNLGIFPSFSPQFGRMPNNILINNLFPTQTLNPQLIGQINNNQINSLLPNNTSSQNSTNNNISNDNNNSNKNFNTLNNLNYVPFPGLNAYIQRPNFSFTNSNDSLKEIDNNIMTMKNLNQNNLFNNNQISQSPPLTISPIIPFSNLNSNTSSILSSNLGNNLNFVSPPLSLYHNTLNIQGNNGPSNLSQKIKTNNNNIEQNNLNPLNLINRNLNLNGNNNKGINLNGINNLSNINLNNINSINNLNRTDLGNNNLNNNPNSISEKEIMLKHLFDCIAESKSKNSLNNDMMNLKNNNNLNNNPKIEMNNNSINNNNYQQINSDFIDKNPAPLNNQENNNTNNNNSSITSNLENNNSSNINIPDEKKGKESNNEKEEKKKDNI